MKRCGSITESFSKHFLEEVSLFSHLFSSLFFFSRQRVSRHKLQLRTNAFWSCLSAFTQLCNNVKVEYHQLQLAGGGNGDKQERSYASSLSGPPPHPTPPHPKLHLCVSVRGTQLNIDRRRDASPAASRDGTAFCRCLQHRK